MPTEQFLDALADAIAERLAARLPQAPPAAPPPQQPPTPFLTTRQAAELLHVGQSTLENWRAEGKGPGFIKLPGGRVRYARIDLQAWAAAHRRAST